MKIKCFVLMLLTISLALKGYAAERKEEPKIKVLLAKEVKGALLESRGGYKVLYRDGKELLTHSSSGKRFVIHALSNGMRWGEEYPGVFAISIHPLDASTVFYVDGMQYKGALHVSVTKKGFINVVNEISIEDYIASVLSVKLGSSFSPEALAALAIAARTNAYSSVFYKNDSSAPWDISAKEESYLGLGVTRGKNGIDEAVLATKFIVLEERPGLPLRHVEISALDAESLASRGMDAKRILRNVVPHSEIGSTTSGAKSLR